MAMKMRNVLVAGLLVAGSAAAVELPRFEVDVSKWRESMGKKPPVVVGEKRVEAVRPPGRCAVRLREIPVTEGARVRVVEPEAGRVFAHREAQVPAEACEVE